MGLFSKGTIELNLNKTSFVSGEEIQGTVKVKMKKPTKGKKLNVVFKGVRIDKYETSSGALGGNDRDRHETKKVVVYEYEVPLGGEQEYTEHEHDFSIMIPPNLAQNSQNPEASCWWKTPQILKIKMEDNSTP
jgi:hypothetical protein